MRDALRPELVERVLARLGFDRHPDRTPDGLRALYGAWGRTVAFDNLVKRVHLATGDPSPIPNVRSDRFFELHLRHGTGGTCWPTALALHALLSALGFEARLGSAAMWERHVGPEHNHGTVLVRLAGSDWLVDTSMLSEEPLRLSPTEVTERDDPVNPMRAEPVDGLWRVWWQQPSSRRMIDCVLLADGVTRAHCAARYEVSRGRSPFNASTYVTRNVEGGKLNAGGGARHEKRGTDLVVEALDRDALARLLVDELGFSEEIVARQPPDES